MKLKTISYAQAGIDIDAGDQFVARIQSAMRRTYGPRVIANPGAFAGLFRLDYDERLFKRNYSQPVLVGCTDSVGTKVLLGIAAGRVRSLGIDLVAMNVNDLITVGAEPLFFLDYLAVNKLRPEQALQIVEGIADGCYQADCALIGGETAEMPDLYRKGEFDLAGFVVGVVERRRLIDPGTVEPGDLIIALASDGIHSNGYTLVRKLLDQPPRIPLDAYIDELESTLADVLLKPTRIYAQPIVNLLRRYRVKRVVRAMAHITGGGLPGNIPRILPPDCSAVIKRNSWPVPRIFGFLQRRGVKAQEMYRVFNMGIGFVLIVRRTFAASIVRRLRRMGESPHIIGRIKRGPPEVIWK